MLYVHHENLFTHEYRMPLTLQTNDIDELCMELYFEFRFNGSADSIVFALLCADTKALNIYNDHL
jgi:hypothetical protein